MSALVGKPDVTAVGSLTVFGYAEALSAPEGSNAVSKMLLSQ